MRMLNEESRDALHPLADATGALRRFQRDAVDDFFYLPDRAFGEAELHVTGLAQRAFISASVASSPRAISASASARSAKSRTASLPLRARPAYMPLSLSRQPRSVSSENNAPD